MHSRWNFSGRMESSTAHVTIKNGFEEIDMGIAKLHFELGTEKAGYWELGNGAEFRYL